MPQTPSYLRRVFLSFDMFLNVLILGGELNETISRHATWSAKQGKRWGKILVKILNFFIKDHCPVDDDYDFPLGV